MMSVVIRERVLQGIVYVVEMDAVHPAITVPMVSVILQEVLVPDWDVFHFLF
jgi:hypothetical protein